MTLNEIIDIIKKIGLSQPNVNSSSEGSIYEVLNADLSIDYANFHITQNKHTANNQFITYNLIFFYTDRLMEGNTNKLSIQSIGIEVLSNILRTLQAYYEDIEISSTDFQPFTERFSDNCAGVYSNVSIEIPIEYTCEETFGNIININGGSNGECECEIKNQYIEVNVNENGKLVVNYNPDIYTGIERVVINTNVPQTIITGDTINNQSKSVKYTNNGTYSVLKDANYTGMDRVDITIDVPQTIISGGTGTFETEDITITKNGTYYPTKDGFNKVLVNVPEKKFIGESRAFTISKNGTYNYFPSEGVDGITQMLINVDVPQEVISGGTTTLTGSIVAKSGYNLFKGQPIISVGDVYIKGQDGNTTNMFQDCQYLTSVGNIYKDEYYFTNLRYMFDGCSNLVEIGSSISNWDTSKVTDLTSMFGKCKSLTSVGDLSNWDTSMVTTMNATFSYCYSLTSLDLSDWDTSNVNKMDYMFYTCSGLTSLDLSGWDMSKVTDMNLMFSYCISLTDLNMDGATLPDIDLTRISLYTCTALTTNSLVSILNALPITTNGYALTIGSTNLAKLTDEQVVIAINKGWTIN